LLLLDKVIALKYRAEIDGLRALAVLPVILFHAGFELFSGGFVGVDVFFVISGYLITTILVEDIEKNRFSLVSFYERRARRILPALFFVMLMCLPFAWAFMPPSQMEDFSQSLIAVSLFVSNILFWRESGYFDSAAEDKPLLHTWSLAVEEQYYLLFPVFLILAWRFGKDRVFWTIVFFAGISLALSEWGWRNSPTANFYLSPTRAWELFAGSIAAFLVQKHGAKSSNILSCIGLFAILFSIFIYDELTPFPSLYALVPVGGVVLLILFAQKDTIAAKLLSTRPLVAIGLISYSAYLWHQPLFAFARIKLNESPSATLMLLLSLASIVLAIFSWKFIEKPFRSREAYSSTFVFSRSSLGIVVFLFLGLILWKTPVFDIKYEVTQLRIIEERKFNRDYMKEQAFDRYGCFFDFSQEASVLLDNQCVKESSRKRILLFGDSEAAHYIEGLRTLEETYDYTVMQFTGASCRAINYPLSNSRCEEFFRIFRKQIVPELSEDDTVLVASNWWSTHEKIGSELLFDYLKSTVDLIKKSGANVVIIGNTPDFIKDPYEQLLFVEPHDTTYLLAQNYLPSDLVVMRVAEKSDVKYFLPANLLCNGLQCKFKESSEYLFFDSGHLSTYGSISVANEILKFMYLGVDFDK